MLLETRCKCGYIFKHTKEEAYKRRMCPACGRDVVLSLPPLSPSSIQTRCPHCGEPIHRLWGPCPKCRRNVAFTTKRLTATVLGVMAAAVMLFMGIAGLFATGRETALYNAMMEYHRTYKNRNWGLVCQYRASNKTETPEAYKRLMNREYRFVSIRRLDIENWRINPDRVSGSALVSFELVHRPSRRTISGQYTEEWRLKGRRWLITGPDQPLGRLLKFLSDENRAGKTFVTCAVCNGRGVIHCQTCKGKGIVENDRFCPDCYRSQGWNVCTECEGAGLVREK